MKKNQLNSADNKSDVMDQFNEILFKHLNRLIGSEYGIGELILNLITISIITLFMERENEIESLPSNKINRYSHESLIKDMQEMGFDDAQDMNIVIEDMIQKNYIHLHDDRLIPQKPMISMARLIDLIFPKMPGMNLIAYFVQTIDEVKSNRKNINSATEQFDQILQMQGVSLKKDSQRHENSKASTRSDDKKLPHKLDESPQNNVNVSQDKEFKRPSILSRKSTDKLFDHSKDSSNGPKVLSSDAYNGKIAITKLIFGGSGSKEAEPDKIPSDKHEHIEDEKLGPSDKFIETLPHHADESQNSETEVAVAREESTRNNFGDQIKMEDTPAVNIHRNDSIPSIEKASQDLKSTDQNEDNSYDDKDNFSNIVSDQNNSETVEEKGEDNPQEQHKKEDLFLNPAAFEADKDNDIEQRIMAFEEDLALECPICRQSKVLAKSTATGKSYYKCSNKECSFISWGKPHHIFCPKCNNPFLIETSNKVGTIDLKCPRATCRYRKEVRSDIPANGKEQMDSAFQTHNKSASISQKPRRRVVRRRVVRRKR